MEVLVTGPDGVLGSNLVRELLKRNYKVSVFLEKGKDPITLKDLPINRYHGNIIDFQSVNEAVKGKDAVLHCAASTSVFPARNPVVNAVNIQGTANIVDSCIEHKVQRLIYVGTANSFAYSNDINNPGTEKGPYLSEKYGLDYMDSKKKAQELVLKAVKERNLPAIVVNPTFMIGPYDSRPSSGAMILGVYQRRVPGYTLGGKNYVAVKDVAFAMANALTMGRIGECYILGNANLSYKEVFETIASSVGVKPPKRKLSSFIVVTYGTLNSLFAKFFKYHPAVTRELAIISCENHFYSPDKARKELLLPETPLSQAIEECFEWFKHNNYLNKR
jgi:dihydroflavonol-4-reductase